MVEGDDLLFDGVRRHQPVDRDRPALADAVGTIGGLILHRRVPPGIHMKHIIGSGEVEADPAGLEADEEELSLAGLEVSDTLLPLLGEG